jgi:Trypsin-like peptidase domain
VRWVAATVVALATGAGAPSGAVGDAAIFITGDHLDRAAWTAQGSVYLIEADHGGGGVSQGLAFAVSPSGHLLTTLHVVEKGGTPARRVLVRAARGQGESFVARVVRVDANSDIALVRIPARGVPALMMEVGGGPVVAFGRDGPADITKGRVGGTGQARAPVNRIVTNLRLPVGKGESGGPVVGPDGRVRGMVLGYFRESRNGFMEPTPALRAMLRSAGVANREGDAAAAFRRGSEALERFDLAGAEAGFRAARAAYPAHPLVDEGLAAVTRLSTAGFRADGAPRSEGLLAAAAVVLGVFALAAVAALLAWRPRPTLEAPIEEVRDEDRDTA